MANTAQAKKRARQSEARRQHNTAARSAMRTAVKTVVKALDAGDKAKAEASYKEMSSMVDASARKGLIDANKAARHKSLLNARIRAL
ncbi:MAG TPA: 30S ribosomal protein S20 [Gammaproteobacteria bacterium]